MKKKLQPLAIAIPFAIFFLIVIVGIIDTKSSRAQNTLSSNTKNNTFTNTYSHNSTSNTDNSQTSNEENIKEVIVADFSKMSKKEIEDWCDKNNIDYYFNEDYSSTVKKGSFISQSVKASETIYEGDEITIVYSLGKEPTLGERNALAKAYSYLRVSSFSYKSLIEQLEFEGFTNSESTYAADNCDANWNEQAVKKAKSYMDYSSFSKKALIEQLEYEGFTKSQSEYGAKAVGY